MDQVDGDLRVNGAHHIVREFIHFLVAERLDAKRAAEHQRGHQMHEPHAQAKQKLSPDFSPTGNGWLQQPA